jgi:hypothetical protein
MRRSLMAAVIVFINAQGQTLVSSKQDKSATYLAAFAAMGEYRALAESSVRDLKDRLETRSPQYNACRDQYAATEESVETYLGKLGDSLEQQERDPELLPAADDATRKAENFFTCAFHDKPEGARMIPVAPFVEFAVASLERFFGRPRHNREAGAALVLDELRWKPWDRIR